MVVQVQMLKTTIYMLESICNKRRRYWWKYKWLVTHGQSTNMCKVGINHTIS